MIGSAFSIINWIIKTIYVLFVKTFRYLYYSLGYQTTEHELAKAIREMSNESPKKYMPLIMLLYSIVYLGCIDCGQTCRDVFDSLQALIKAKNGHSAVNFDKIRQNLKKYNNNSNKFILTNEILLSLQENSVSMTKEYPRNLMSYIRCWLMASSMYCPHQRAMSMDNAKPQNLTMQESSSNKGEAEIFKSSIWDSTMSHTNKSRKSHSSSPRKRHNIEKNEDSVKTQWVLDNLFYPKSLLYALQMLPERSLIHKHHIIEDLTILTVHVVSSSLLLETEHWEVFMHGLSKLNRLNVVFVIQDKSFKKSFKTSNWEVNNRIITYSVQYMHYHMYFSSDEYIDPDVVVVYDNNYEMSASKESDVHREISYLNMTHDPETILVLMDSTEELVKQGVRVVNAARPVNQIMLPQINHIRGYSSNRSEFDSKTEKSLIENNYFTCLNRK